MADILTSISTRSTPQHQKARPEQVQNAAGGFVFEISDEARLHRFLTLGTADSTYYTSAKDLTRENADVLFRAIAADPVKVINHIVEISVAGRAPKQNPALFALAVAASHGTDDARRTALAVLPQVARTGSTLFTFIKYAEQFRGWGPAFVKAIARWYNEKPVDQVAYQVLKYRNRENMRHDDVLRQAHPVGDAAHNALYNWLAATSPSAGTRRKAHGEGRDLFGNPVDTPLPELVEAYRRLRSATHVRDVLAVLNDNGNISWEMIPDEYLNEPLVWESLISHTLPQTALLRQLPRITNLNLGSGTMKLVADQLQNPEALKRARVHPVNVLVAQKTYAQGHGEKGKLNWTPHRRITDALDAAFYASYGAVEPAAKRTLQALDVSASMEWANCSGLPITPREACAAISLVTANTEKDSRVVGFCSGGTGFGRSRNGIAELDISPRRRLDDVVNYTRRLPYGGTDVSLPMLWAQANKVPVDTFLIYTDNETWAGAMHPHQALERYRQAMGIDAKLVVAAMTATGTSVCDPNDPLRQMDISGFDSSCPQLMADFSAGRV